MVILGKRYVPTYLTVCASGNDPKLLDPFRKPSCEQNPLRFRTHPILEKAGGPL